MIGYFSLIVLSLVVTSLPLDISEELTTKLDIIMQDRSLRGIQI